MKGRSTEVNSEHFKYLTGEAGYSFPIEDAFVFVHLASSEPVTLYATKTRDPAVYHPLGIGHTIKRQYRLRGFDQLIIKTKKAARIALILNITTKSDLDPLDYTPVIIDPPQAQSERQMIEIALDHKLQSMGIDTSQMPQSEDDGEDLEFYPDENTMAETIYTEKPPQPQSEEPEPELPLEGEQTPSSTAEKPSKQDETAPSEDSKDESVK